MSIFRDISGKRLQEQEPQQKNIKKSSFSQLEESSFRNLSIETFKHTPIKNLELETSFKGREVVIVGHAQEGERASLQADDNTPVNFLTPDDWSTSQYDSFDLIRSTKNVLIFDDSIANPLTNENSEIARSLFRKINCA